MSDFDSITQALSDKRLKLTLHTASQWPAASLISERTALYGEASSPSSPNSPGNLGLSPNLGSDLTRLAASSAGYLLGSNAMDEPFVLPNGAFHAGTFGEVSPWFAAALNDYNLSIGWSCLKRVLQEFSQSSGKVDRAPRWEGGVGLEAFTMRLSVLLAVEFPPIDEPGRNASANHVVLVSAASALV